MRLFRPNLHDLFTPRSSDYGSKLFIERKSWDEELEIVLNTGMHALVFGENGVGKSWFVGHFLNSRDYDFITVNCARVTPEYSLQSIISDLLSPLDSEEPNEHQTIYESGFSAGAVGKITHSTKYQIHAGDRLIYLTDKFLKKGKKNKHAIIFDNAEFLGDSDTFVSSLKHLIVALGGLESKTGEALKLIVVVATRSSGRLALSIPKVDALRTRLQELPPLVGFARGEVHEFCERAFHSYLKANLDEHQLMKWSEHIRSVTLGIPLYVQIYTKSVALELEKNNWNPPLGIFSKIDLIYSGASSLTSRAQLQEVDRILFKAKSTKKILYTMAMILDVEFTLEDIHRRQSDIFQDNLSFIAVKKSVERLASEPTQLIEKAWEPGFYKWRSPQVLTIFRHRMVLTNEKEVKINI